MSNRELARQMGRSESYVRARINDEKEWNLNDIGIISQIWAISPDRLVIPMVEEADDSTAPRLHEEASADDGGASDASVDALYREARGTEPIDIDAWADRIKAEDGVAIHDADPDNAA